MRGKLKVAAGAKGETRITPADAGKTQKGCFVFGRNEDHPRGCGENGYKEFTSNTIPGSPPRMRGKLLFKPLYLCIKGITPADAGKTH